MRLSHIKELNPFLRSFLYIISGDIAIYVGMELLNSESVDITDEDITENIKESIKGSDIDFEPNDSEILKLNTVRKTLYKLYSEKLAQFRRIRDKSTGWFIYYWWHEFDLFEEILLEKKNLIESKLRDRLQFEQNNYFFYCKNCQESNIKYNFDKAFELNFRCPDCGNPLEAQDNQSIIEYLKNKIGVIQNIKISID
ncbi:MAG: transcription factor [Promethearchaeota archaeon Loki_b32]|nr:transcription factor [Candidatus Lokiarchaeota archaeon]MCK4479087.1 transcription factor [Candidatus Lokiarchaeota archaeon]TKJ22492.1 MAG: transcription factor [Candidatus Lokiarchaeota archaeon Loki_b32]